MAARVRAIFDQHELVLTPRVTPSLASGSAPTAFAAVLSPQQGSAGLAGDAEVAASPVVPTARLPADDVLASRTSLEPRAGPDLQPAPILPGAELPFL